VLNGSNKEKILDLLKGKHAFSKNGVALWEKPIKQL
jgi:hypothetical protein